MNLNDAQLVTLGNFIVANLPGLSDTQQASALNELASPDYWVFRTRVSTDRARAALVWSEVLAPSAKLPAEERWAFDTMMGNGTFDPGVENNRTGLATIFAGSGFAATRAALLATSARLATLGEKALSAAGTGPGGGNGSASTASAVLGFWLGTDGERIYAEGLVTTQNVINAKTAVGA